MSGGVPSISGGYRPPQTDYRGFDAIPPVPPADAVVGTLDRAPRRDADAAERAAYYADGFDSGASGYGRLLGTQQDSADGAEGAAAMAALAARSRDVYDVFTNNMR